MAEFDCGSLPVTSLRQGMLPGYFIAVRNGAIIERTSNRSSPLSCMGRAPVALARPSLRETRERP